MKTAIFGDLHGNFTAWQQAFSLMKQKDIDKFFCTGDLVGYGPQPDKIVSDIQNKIEAGLNFKVVVGNHDKGAVNDNSLSQFNSHARRSLLWTREQLSVDNQQFLRNCPQLIEENNFILTHGTPNNPTWEYLRPWGAANIFANHQFKYCFVGHTHLLQLFISNNQGFQPEEKTIAQPGTIDLQSNQRILVNVGSIGQPRDHDPRGSFIIWDQDKQKLEVVRFEYDIDRVQELIYNTDLPSFEAERLAKGR